MPPLVPATSIFTATGSPVTGAGTLGFTTAGTSGGIPYFSSAAALSSSAVLTANLPVIGGGAGVAPSVGSVSGTTTKFATVNTTTFATGQCVQVDASLNLTTTGSACGAGGGGTPGGSTTQVQYNNAGAFGGASNITTNGTSFTEADINVSSSTSVYTIHGSAFTSTGININSSGNIVMGGDGSGVSLSVLSGVGIRGGSTAAIAFIDTAAAQRLTAQLFEVGVNNTSGIIEQRFTTIPQAYRVYNTTDGPVANYERGVMDWTTTPNTLTIGTQALGTGQVRNVQLQAGGSGSVGAITLRAPGGNVNMVLNANTIFFSDNTITTSTNGGVTLGSSSNDWGSLFISTATRLMWSSSAGSGVQDLGIGRSAAKVLQFTDGNAANSNGWHQWAGETRATANTSITSSTTLVPVTGLTTNVQAGRTYGFQAELSGTWAAAGGVRAAIAGTATATNIVYDGWIVDSAANGIKGNAQSAALAGVVANAATTGTAGHVTISGAITVNAAGTLLVQAAQSVSNAGATAILQGSTFFVWDMP